jgi:hypothetical protein
VISPRPPVDSESPTRSGLDPSSGRYSSGYDRLTTAAATRVVVSTSAVVAVTPIE